MQTDTSNLKNIGPMRLGDILRRLDPSDGSVEPFQIPAEPNEPLERLLHLLPARPQGRANDRRPSAADAHALPSSNELGSLVVRLSPIKGYTTEQAVAPRPVYGIGKRWDTHHRQLQERWEPPPPPRASPSAN